MWPSVPGGLVHYTHLPSPIIYTQLYQACNTDSDSVHTDSMLQLTFFFLYIYTHDFSMTFPAAFD